MRGPRRPAEREEVANGSSMGADRTAERLRRQQRLGTGRDGRVALGAGERSERHDLRALVVVLVDVMDALHCQ